MKNKKEIQERREKFKIRLEETKGASKTSLIKENENLKEEIKLLNWILECELTLPTEEHKSEVEEKVKERIRNLEELRKKIRGWNQSSHKEKRDNLAEKIKLLNWVLE